ncbi:hypothetical protein R1flu_003192 [Riccia fluitans]|uniref:Uncharacterized protein n=1 Tax=Riccia fluitans TaxID=41844 RepID=A0ABD1YBB7_9MARC
MWRADNYIVGVSFVRGHRTLQDEVDQTGIDACYSSLCKGLKVAVGTLPNSLAVFDYMRSIFDSYVNPTNDPNIQPLVKGLDADDFSVNKFQHLWISFNTRRPQRMRDWKIKDGLVKKILQRKT